MTRALTPFHGRRGHRREVTPRPVDLPWLTAEQMAEVDRAMVQDYGILLPQMMELAGRHLASLARERFRAETEQCLDTVILAGTGGNGGGALVAARRLAGWGINVAVVLAANADRLGEVPRHQLEIVRQMGIEVHDAHELLHHSPGLIIDGLLGYGIRGDPRERAAMLIRWANTMAAPTLALDLPSGLDATTGAAGEPTIEATATMTLALPKEGLRKDGADRFVGELYLADIGVPRQLYARPPLNLAAPDVFATSDRVRLS